MASFKLNRATDDDDEDGEILTPKPPPTPPPAEPTPPPLPSSSSSVAAPAASSSSSSLASSSSDGVGKASALDKFREGTGDKRKCPSCRKTVYKMEELLALGFIWHKDCFTCGGPPGGDDPSLGCGRVLTIDAHDQHAGLPYCRGCFQRKFMLGGARGAVLNLPERGDAAKKGAPSAPPAEGFTHLGGGGTKCGKCNKTVYKMEEVSCIGNVWHKACFTCGGATDLGCGYVRVVRSRVW
jgi:cysteine/glycine-rich protein